MQTTILVISNPISGDGKGRQFLKDNVFPLLDGHKYEIQETIGAGAAGSLAAAFLRKHQHMSDITIVLVISGGDGTVHEVVNGIGLPSRPVQLVICPQGTANAIYSTLFPLCDQLPTVEYRLRSLHAFLRGRTKPLNLTQTSFFDSDGQVTKMILGIVVTSTAFHASILETADHYRSSIPSIERFKVAAAENISNWYQSDVRIWSSPERTLHLYNPVLGAFESLGAAELDMRGPFVYFLSTVNVDRLEPAFEISSLFARLPPGREEMDLVVIRPLRDPTLQSDSQESRTAFIQKLSAVFQGAYNQGGHVTLRYRDRMISDVGEGPLVVEYIRCGGWEWLPNRSDNKANLVCVDGTVLHIQENGKVSCEVLRDNADVLYFVCA